MSTNIKELVKTNKTKRETYIKEKHSEAFQTALLKIENRLKQYDPSKELLKVEISPFVDNKNKELCLQLIAHLRLQGIDCEYEYVPEYSGRHDYNPEYHYIVFKF